MRTFLSITVASLALSLFACGAPAPDGSNGAGEGAATAAAPEATESSASALKTPVEPSAALSCTQQCAGLDDSHNIAVCRCHCNHGTNCGLYW